MRVEQARDGEEVAFCYGVCRLALAMRTVVKDKDRLTTKK